MMMKHGSLREIDEAIHYFNANLQRHTDMSVEFRKGIFIPRDENGIKIALETIATSKNSPITLELDSYALYNFYRGGLPAIRMAPSILDIRDYFATSLLKRPEYAVLNLKVTVKAKLEKLIEKDGTKEAMVVPRQEVFMAYFNVGYRRVLKVDFPEEVNEVTERYRRSIEDLSRGKNFQKAIDLAFKIYDEADPVEVASR